MGWIVVGAALWLVLLPAAVVAAFMVRVSRRARELRLLVEDGIETTGRVVNPVPLAPSASRRPRYLRYEYRDPAGRVRTHRSAVSSAFWDDHQEGSEVAVVYSASRLDISAPRDLVEQTREALARQAARR